MPLMGSLYVGTSGLQTSQNSLNTTAHNLSNIDTTGYTRQQVLQGNKIYNTVGNAYVSEKQVGLGVNYSKVRQVRDYFLDQSYRKEIGRSAFYASTSSALSEVETLFGEMEGVQFQESLSDLRTALEELAKDPSSSVNQGLLVSQASNFVERANAVYSGLCSYQDNLNEEIKEKVNTINEYGKKIYQLNAQIKEEESGGAEEANDLRDARNTLLDELGTLVNMSYSEDIYGSVSVSIEGASFVTDGNVFEMGVVMQADNEFYTPVWPTDKNAPVFDLSMDISSDMDTDIGELKALLVARGDRRADYTDLADETVYKEDIADSMIMNTMAEFDQLIHGIVTGINNVLNPNDTAGQDLFLRLGTSDITTAEDPTGADTTTLFSTSNLKINPDMLKQPTLLGNGFLLADKKVDQTKADALLDLFDAKTMTLNPTVAKESDFIDYYSDLVGQIANLGSVYRGISTNQEATVESINNSRQQVVGVSDNEELTNMIKFQNAYNASSRYINAVNEMIGHLIERLG